MGNEFSRQLSAYLLPHLWRQDEPDSFAPYKYDAQFGYDKPRPLIVNRATKEMMDSGNLSDDERDYCAMERLNYRGCMRGNSFLGWRCQGFLNEIHLCKLEEVYHDMKEFEREKRLNARDRKLKEAAQA